MRAATASVISLAEIRRNLPMLRAMLRRGKNHARREASTACNRRAASTALSDGNACVMKAVSL
jgi:hypothetical protein